MAATVDTVSFSCDLPVPSNNTYYRNFRGHMVLSSNGRKFKADIANILVGCRQVKGPVKVKLALRWKDKRKRDLDNYFKAVFDAIKNKLIEDDDTVYELNATKSCGNKSCESGFDIEITSMDIPEHKTLEGRQVVKKIKKEVVDGDSDDDDYMFSLDNN